MNTLWHKVILLALRSTCQRLSVGATIVKDNRIIAGGYNGSVAGEVHCIDEGCLMKMATVLEPFTPK